jgi:mono/diheme cytochrome c family protein
MNRNTFPDRPGMREEAHGLIPPAARMAKQKAIILAMSLALLLALPRAAFASSGATPSTPQSPPEVGETPEELESWLIIDLPPDATQVMHGMEIYRLVCSACHAYDGSGLTDEWRATWNPEDQNCWQSKCHAENHPPDGFFLPYSPAVVGPAIPALFENAHELYQYTRQQMPWHNPQSLTDEEYWAVTAYLLELNGFDPGPHLDKEVALRMQLRPLEVGPPPAPTAVTQPVSTLSPAPSPTSAQAAHTGTAIPAGLAGGVLLVGAVVAFLILRRKA